jgi:hypothetical protein
MDSQQKRERDRNQRRKREDKEARRKQRAEDKLLRQTTPDTVTPPEEGSAIVEGVPAIVAAPPPVE